MHNLAKKDRAYEDRNRDAKGSGSRSKADRAGGVLLACCLGLLAHPALAGLKTTVEVEESITTFEPAKNGAGPTWCFGSSVAAPEPRCALRGRSEPAACIARVARSLVNRFSIEIPLKSNRPETEVKYGISDRLRHHGSNRQTRCCQRTTPSFMDGILKHATGSVRLSCRCGLTLQWRRRKCADRSRDMSRSGKEIRKCLQEPGEFIFSRCSLCRR